MASLQARLFVGLNLLVLVAGLAAGAFAYDWAYGEAIELQDAVLQQVGALAAGARHQDTEPADEEIDAEARIVVEEVGQAPSQFTGGRHPILDVPGDRPDGLQTFAGDGKTWRIVVRTRSDGSRVAVGQLTATRDEIARDSALGTVIPLFALIPCLMLLVGYVIHRGFRPVSALAARLDATRSDHLDPLPLEGIPSELIPFVTSINRLLARIATLFEQQKRFVADAAHELRTPITALSVQAENLDHPSLSPEGRERLTVLRTGIRRTSRLLDQLLALARSEAIIADRAPITHFERVATDVVTDLLPSAQAHGIDLGFARIESVRVRAEPAMLAVLVRNLVDNAIRHTPDGGRIDIDLGRQGGCAVFQIEDTGPGIPDQELQRVFEPFVRGSRALGEGSGLGLSIVDRIARSLGGAVTATNIDRPEGTGLRVGVNLPACSAME